MSGARGLLADLVPASCVDGPGNRYVVFVQGCTFNCLACHNPHTIARRQVDSSRWVDIGEVLDGIRDAAPFISGITVSGGEATCQWQFVVELFRAVKTEADLSHLTAMVDTNGDADPDVWRALDPWMDGAMVDLKALDDDVHEMLTGRSNDRVLASIHQLASMGKLHEVRLLIIPGLNDDEGMILRTAEWLAAVDPDLRVRLNGFRRHGVRPVARSFTEATSEHLTRVAALLVDGGLRSDRVTAAHQANRADATAITAPNATTSRRTLV